MNSPWHSSREAFSDVLQAITSASWRTVGVISDLIPLIPEEDGTLCQLFLNAICTIRDEPRFSENLRLLAEFRITSAVELSIAGAHLSMCSQFVCLQNVDEARREALAFVQHAIAAAHFIGFAISDSEQEMFLEKAYSLPDRIDAQQCLSLATSIGHVPRKMLIVLGMHRSGTSALSGMLRDIGLDAPKDLMPPTKDNPKGYFESIGVISENERLLSALGTSWRFDKPMPRGWIDQQPAAEWRKAILRKLRASFDGATFPVLKDPRLCLLLAGLRCWLQADAIDFRFVLVVRHPLEVVKSLLARAQDPIAKDASLHLWIESVLSAERHTRGFPRMVVIADDLFKTPDQVQAELQSFIDLNTQDGECEGFSSFVDPDLQHQRFNKTMLRQPAWGMSQCGVLEDLAIRIYEEIKIHKASLSRESFDEFNNLWIHVN